MVRLGGQDITRLATHEIVRRGIGWVPEERRVLPNLTVLENLRLGMMATAGAGSEQRLEEALAFFPRLRERIEQKGRFLSGGEQQMLAIARGLVARPKIMLVDEPTEGLAPLLVQTLTDILREINKRGTTILLVEQTLEVAMALSHRLYVMDQGRIQFEGTPDALRQRPHDPAAVPAALAGARSQRSASASLAPSATNAAANVRRIQVRTRGRETTWLRIAAANSP